MSVGEARWTLVPLLAWLTIASVATGCGGSPPPLEDASDQEGEPITYTIALRLEDAGEDAEGTPRTRVSLVRIAPDGNRTVVEGGEEPGPCYLVVEPDALTAARCWWAGAGSRYAVRRHGDALALERATEDADGAPGAYEARGSVELEDDARLELLGQAPAPPPGG
ncbi:MAG: hypothetical protein AB7S26_30165 [Sandaracinaceae bacterium]